MKLNCYILLIVLISLLQGCTKLTEDLNEVSYNNPIKVAYLGPFSEVRMGAEGKFLGAYLASEEINKNGGVYGRDIEIIRYNDGGSGPTGAELAKKLHAQGIDLILGADWSSVTLAVANQVAIPETMLMITYSSTSPDISSLADNNLVWRTVPSDAYQGRIGADYCFKVMNKRTAGILCFNNPWAIGLSNAFKTEFQRLGGTVTSFNIYPELFGDAISKYDYSPHLDSLFAPKPEVVYFAAFPADGAKISADMAQKNYLSNGYKPLFFSNDGLYSNYFLLNGFAGVIEGVKGTAPGSSVNDVEYRQFSENYKNRWGFDPVPFAEHAYDAMYVLVYAILQAKGSTKPLDIAANLQSVSGGDLNSKAIKVRTNQFKLGSNVISNNQAIDYDGPSGKINFDSNGDPGSGTYLIWEIKDLKYKSDTSISFP